jgi:hypothetical protein
MAGISYSPAGSALLGGGVAGQVTPTESDEEWRKRLAAIAQSQSRLSSSGYSPASQMLLGGYGGSL